MADDAVPIRYEKRLLDEVNEVIDQYRDVTPAKLTYVQVIGVLQLVQHQLVQEGASDD